MASAATTALKLGLSLAIVAYVVVEVDADAAQILQAIGSVTERWHRLIIAYVLLLTALGLGIVRWRLITQAVGITLTLKQAFRLGAMAFTLNFAGFGAIGGDLFKAGLLARDNPDNRVPAIVSVAADRVVGLFALLLVATVAALLVESGGPELRALITASVSVTVFAGLAIAAVLGSEHLTEAMLRQLDRLWPSGSILHRVIRAVSIYRSHPRLLFLALLMSLGIQTLNVMGFHFIALSLPPPAPGLAEQFLIVPLALVCGAIPLPLGALGILDYSMSHLYSIVTVDRIAMSQGLLTTMTYRVTAAATAILGLFFFLTSQHRRRISSGSGEGAAATRASRRTVEMTDTGEEL